MPQETAQSPAAPGKKVMGRGVSYPFFGLEEAIEKARAFHKEERKSSAPVASAIKHFGYAEKSGNGRQTLSALLQFGLLEDEGKKDDRQVKLTDRALTILLDVPESQARLAALQECVRTPKLYATLLAKYQDDLPSDHTIGFFLQKEFDFNPKTLKAFIEDFRASLAYAKLVPSSKIPESERPKEEPIHEVTAPTRPQPEVGDMIQWEASGVLQMEAPRRVRGKTEHEGAWWVFVEGSETGIPMSEAVLIEKKAPETAAPKAPPLLAIPAVVSAAPAAPGEREWLRGPLSREVNYRLMVTGEIGPKEIGKLIKLLEAQKDVLDDDL
jgi:hypothetical protein